MARDNESYIFRGKETNSPEGGVVSPNTRAIHSTRNKIFAYSSGTDGNTFTQIGVISSFNPTQSRAAEPIRGIGFGDNIAELVPAVMEPVTISIERSALYMSNLMNAFGYNYGIDGIVRGLKHHKWPFDIKHSVVYSEYVRGEAAGSGAYNRASQATITFFEGCWMTSFNFTVTSDGAVITDSADVYVTDIHEGTEIVKEATDTGNTLKSRIFSIRV